MDRGFWSIQGPHDGVPKRMRWRVEYIPRGKNGYSAGLGWAETEDKAKEKARRYNGQPEGEDPSVGNCLKAGVCGCSTGRALEQKLNRGEG